MTLTFLQVSCYITVRKACDNAMTHYYFIINYE